MGCTEITSRTRITNSVPVTAIRSAPSARLRGHAGRTNIRMRSFGDISPEMIVRPVFVAVCSALCFAALSAAPAPASAQRVVTVGITQVQGAYNGPSQQKGSFAASSLSLNTASDSTRGDPRPSAWGAAVGAVTFGGLGLLAGLGGCDAAGSNRTCVTQIAVGGAVVGAIVGYAIGSLIESVRH